MTAEIEYRQFECTDCTHRNAEYGATTNLRPGDIAMRRCSSCKAETLQMLCVKRLVKNSRVKEKA